MCESFPSGSEPLQLSMPRGWKYLGILGQLVLIDDEWKKHCDKILQDMNSNSHLSETPSKISFRLAKDKLLCHQVTYGKYQKDLLLFFFLSVQLNYKIMES